MYSLPKIGLPIVERFLRWWLTHLLVLKVIKENPGINTYQIRKVIRERYGMLPHTAWYYKTIYMLKLKGLIRWEKCEREKKLFITEKGDEIYESVVNFLDNCLRSLR